MPNRLAVSSADFIRNIGHWQNEALRQPVCITHHGRARLVLAAPDQFETRLSTDIDAATREELAELKAGAAAVLENLHEGFIGFDAHQRIESANAMAEVFIGAARDALRHHTVREALPDPLASILSERLHRVAQTRKPEAFECGAFDGRQIAVRVFPMGSGVAFVFQNVTEQHLLRRDREETAALEAAAHLHERVALARIDARGRIEDVDPTFCAWTGFVSGDLVGHRFADLAQGGARRDLTSAIERVLREGAPTRTELTLVGRNGNSVGGPATIAPVLADFIARGARLAWTRNMLAE